MDGALSYFVGGNSDYPEDNGFAIRPWSQVEWKNIGTKIIGDMGVAMGNYYFTPDAGGDAVKVEYSLALNRRPCCRLTAWVDWSERSSVELSPTVIVVTTSDESGSEGTQSVRHILDA